MIDQPRARTFFGSSRRIRASRLSVRVTASSTICGARRNKRSTRPVKRSPARSTAVRVCIDISRVRLLRFLCESLSFWLATRATASHAVSVSVTKFFTRLIRETAQAVGVLCLSNATSSATLVSVSCPIPVSTGNGEFAIAKAIFSSSKVDNSLLLPPPRITTMTSRSSR